MRDVELSVETRPDERDVDALSAGLTEHALPTTGRPGSAHLDTFSYQARPFYERHGYTVFAALDDYPPGHRRFFLRKSLGPAGSA